MKLMILVQSNADLFRYFFDSKNLPIWNCCGTRRML
jgi:hypothetical protein